MAGYSLTSLDEIAFQEFIASPDEKLLKRLAQAIDQEYGEYCDDLEEDDIAHSWSGSAGDYLKNIASHLLRDDWYAPLSDDARSIWEAAFHSFCLNNKQLKFRSEVGDIYWDAIYIALEYARKHSANRPPVLERFGNCPFRMKLMKNDPMKCYFSPLHSLHPTAEVRQMIQELEAAEPAIRASRDAQAIRDYENILMPSLDQISNDARMLLVLVDT